MPIQVLIEVNGQPIETIHIGRLEGSATPDSENSYAVVVRPYTPSSMANAKRVGLGRPYEMPSNQEWERGQRFTHRYGDGIEVCVAKALNLVAASRVKPYTD